MAKKLSEEIFTCDICYEEQSYENQFIVDKCDHKLCRQCASLHIDAQMEKNAIPIMCPYLKCHTEIPEYLIQSVISNEKFTLYFKKGKNLAILTHNYKTCPQQDCEGVVDCEENIFCCPICQYNFCMECKVQPYHYGKSCEEHTESVKEERSEVDDKLFSDYMNLQGFGKCPKCNTPIEKINGCNHMNCICKTHFCYVCKAVLDPNDPYAHFKGTCVFIEYSE